MLINFSQQPEQLPDDYKTLFGMKTYRSFADWQNERLEPSAIIIESDDAAVTSTLLENIRRDDTLFASLCYVSGIEDTYASQLSDGQLPPPPDLQEAINRFTALSASYKYDNISFFHLQRLIRYFWLRPGLVLQPYHVWQHTHFYRYPLLEALSQDQIESFDWLKNLTNNDILEPLSLIDRQAACNYCGSSHLSFVDVCPNCQSIDIEMQSSLHCFTCGCVDLQEKFVHAGVLKCPNCYTQLRHIGSDYDRPIEMYRCLSCNHAFVDGEVVARCAVCHKKMPPNDLMINRINSWQLSDRGRVIAIHGQTQAVSASFHLIDFTSNEIFIHDLDWFLTLSRRYPDIHFSVFGIYFANFSQFIVSLGHTKLLQLLESFSQRLKSLLRTPDLITQTAENMLWVLLPHTDQQGLNGFTKRLETSIQTLFEDSEQKLDCRFISAVSAQIADNETADLLLARLQGQLQ